MLSKKLMVILVLAALLVATQVAEVEAGVNRKEDTVARKDGAVDADKNEDSDVKGHLGWQPDWP